MQAPDTTKTTTVGLGNIEQSQDGKYQAVIGGAGRAQFEALGAKNIRYVGKPEAVSYGVENVVPCVALGGRL